MPEKWFERDSEGEDIEQIFDEMQEFDIPVEGRGRKIIYDGPAFYAEITGSEAYYLKRDGAPKDEGARAWGYMEYNLKRKGYVPKTGLETQDSMETDLKTAD